MMPLFSIEGPKNSLHVFGVKLVGVNAETGTKVILTIALVAVIFLLRWLLQAVTARLYARTEKAQTRFWARQVIQVGIAFIFIVGGLSIWFDDPARLSTGLGLVTAGLAFALQKVVASLAGYVIILRGRTFNVGDRITMGGVRGDVLSLGFMQTTIMEMGQPPPVQNADPAMWVKARQFSGRIVTVSNSTIFDEPVYNYSRDFPYLWEEISIPVSFRDDRKLAERILLEAAERHTVAISDVGAEHAREMERRFLIKLGDLKPRVFLRITDNWVELTVRFIVRDHEIREIKDAMSRQILSKLQDAGIGIASTTFEVVGLPPVRLRMEEASPSAKAG